MPNIEIISIRFNLGKDTDRRLFQILQERPDSGKRNEFLKQVLSDCLLKEHSEGNRAAKPSKKPVKEPPDSGKGSARPDTGQLADNSLHQAMPEPAPVTGNRLTSSQESHHEPDQEAAGIVNQFVQ